MTRIVIDPLDSKSVSNAMAKLDDWQRHTLDLTVDAFADDLASNLKDLMAQDAHGPDDNPANTGGLIEQIRNAQVESLGPGERRITVKHGRVFGRIVNPSREISYGDGPHGFTPGPHDFTKRAKEEIKEHANEIWQYSNGGIL